MKQLNFKKLITIDEMIVNMDLIKDLTPLLTADLYEGYLKEMIPHNYFQVIALLNEEVIGLSGYWIGTKIYCGRYLEIDNFIIKEAYRNAGVGKAIIKWMEEEARHHQCKLLMLDAYIENFKAHAFYYRLGFIARGFHYLKELN
jgi:GNAT superfamily N-acetyltransferase